MAFSPSTSYSPQEMTYATNINGSWQVQKFQQSEVESPLYLVSKPGDVPPPMPMPPPPPPSNYNYTALPESPFPPVEDLLEPLEPQGHPVSYNEQSPWYYTCYDSGFVGDSNTFGNYEVGGPPSYVSTYEPPPIMQENHPVQEISYQPTLPQEKHRNDPSKISSRYLRGNRRNARNERPFHISSLIIPHIPQKQVAAPVNSFVTVTSTFQLPLEEDPIGDRSTLVKAKPHRTIAKPQRTIAKPQRTIAKPQRTIAKPQRTIAKPQRTIAKPQRTTEKPQRTTEKPQRTIAKPQRTIAKPQWTIAKPQRTIAKPQRTIAKPQGTGAKPQRTTAKPQRTTAKPQRTIAKPQWTTEKPQWTTAKPQQTIAKPQLPRRQKLERAASIARSKGASNLALQLEEYRLKDRAKSTVEAYSAALDRFVSWWAADPERFKWPQNEARKFYVAHLIEKKTFKTIPQSIAALNYFLGTLEEKDAKVVEALLDTASRERPAAVTTAKATIEDLQGIVIMGTKTKDVTTIRMAAACVLLFRSMLRLGELLLLQTEDLWNDGDGWKVFIRHSNLTVPFSTGTEDEDQLLIELANRSEDEKRQDNFLLMNANGSRMLHDVFSRSLKSLLYNCGISQTITSQSFRCGGASYLITNGSPVDSVMQMGRWKCAEAFRRHVYAYPEETSVEAE